MVSKRDSWRKWWYLIPMVALLLGLGVAAYALQAKSGAAPLTGKAAVQPNAVSGGTAAAPVDINWDVQAPVTTNVGNGVTVIHSVKNDVSPALRDIPNAPSLPRISENEGPGINYNLGSPAKDPVVQNWFGALAMPTPSVSFEGISSVTSGCGCLPPDTNGDVGPNHYVQTVNSAFQIWDKTGTVLRVATNFNTLFAGFGGPCQTRNDGDPVVLYDSLADRWFITQFTTAPPYYECVVVSTSADPLGTYNRYAFNVSPNLLYDYSKFGVWPDAYYGTANRFLNGASFDSPVIMAFDRAAMIAGTAATLQQVNPGSFYFGIQPADLDGTVAPPAGSPGYFATSAGTQTTIRFWKYHVDWINPLSTTLTGPINIGSAPFDPDLCGGSRNCIPQPATVRRLDTVSSGRFMHRLAYRNFGDHESLVASTAVDVDGADHAGVRWWELRGPQGTPFVYQQGTYAPDADNRWMPGISQDKDGNIAIAYSVASTTTFPSIRYAGRLATDPLGTLGQGEATLIAGTGSQTSTSGRWGDYAGRVTDPTDDCTFWMTTEYYATTSNAGWQTRVGSFKFPSCGAPTTPTPTVTGTPPTATRTATPAPVITPCGNYTYTVGTTAFVSGTQGLNIRCDDCSTLVNAPFPIQMYGGATYNSGYVSSNGNIQFNSSDSAFGAVCLPVPIFEDAVLAYWDDLITNNNAAQDVFSSTTGTAPNRIWNLEWRAQALRDNSNVNFEIRFYEGQQRFDIVYAAAPNGGNGATVGVIHDNTYFTQYSCNANPPLTAGLSLSFTLNCVNATPTPNATATRTATPIPTTCPVQFVDVANGSTFYEFIRCLACRGIVNGYPCGGPGEPCPGNYFRPNANVTRGQVSKIVSESAAFADPVPS
ncbi:MAG: S-layer homology domain-containing protein, partial [Acidobacteriota bacterium]